MMQDAFEAMHGPATILIPVPKPKMLSLQGIETVRRDGCPAVVKIQERAMRTLFETSDLSAVRAYLQRQWTKILAGRVSLQDFVFAKEASGRPPL
jgi:DNA polymerase zeta